MNGGFFRRNRSVWIPVFCLAAACANSGHAQTLDRADRKETADRLLSEGIEAYQAGRYSEAAELYRRSIKAWPTDLALANLCNLVLYGQGIQQDFSVALRLCLTAAKMGNANAQVMLGEMYIFGQGVEADEARALEYFQLAADQGHPHGQYAIGSVLIQSNDPAGIDWLSKAAKQGHAKAAELLKSLTAKPEAD